MSMHERVVDAGSVDMNDGHVVLASDRPALVSREEIAGQRAWVRVLALVALLFFVKAAMFAWNVTPLWDTPDEVGHYSYIESLAAGEYPVLGKAKIAADVAVSWHGEGAGQQPNWIAQHPPLYYLLDTPVLLAARALGFDFEHQVRATRLLTALFGAGAVLGMGLFIGRATGSRELGLGAAIFLAATPMFLHLSSGVTHDTLLACTAAWAAERYARWLQSGRIANAYACAALLAAGCMTKITALALAVPLCGFIAWRLLRADGPWRPRLMHIVGIGATAFLPTSVWMLNNLLRLGHPLADSSDLAPQANHVAIGLWTYLTAKAFWETTLINYLGLIGWNGTGHGQLVWFQMAGFPLRFFLGAIVLCGFLVPLRSLVQRYWQGSSGLAVLVPALTVVAYLALSMQEFALAHRAIQAIALATLWLAGEYLTRAWRGEPAAYLLVSACVCVLFFSAAYFLHLWRAYDGVLRATHGRYFYPVLPFVFLALAWPWRTSPLARAGLLLAIASLLVSDGFFLQQVFTFYRQVQGG